MQITIDKKLDFPYGSMNRNDLQHAADTLTDSAFKAYVLLGINQPDFTLKDAERISGIVGDNIPELEHFGYLTLVNESTLDYIFHAAPEEVLKETHPAPAELAAHNEPVVQCRTERGFTFTQDRYGVYACRGNAAHELFYDADGHAFYWDYSTGENVKVFVEGAPLEQPVHEDEDDDFPF